ncbi:hypothetical protein Ahy_A06g029749 [Arachis hypogaea]|uniref:DUF4283 domain-containing protein n=1 Tax=Arachis hypogaea TaxID=3818 RepID=A0A445CU64_ARAHY|nr:hypothetical protein Ahy_A06g029749 [Arachis hypogaea]
MVVKDYLSNQKPVDFGTEFQAPFNLKPSIEVILEEYDEWCRWFRKEAIWVMDLEKGFFLVQFSCHEDYGYVLFEGPWMIADHYMLVQRWRPLFIPQETEMQKLATWMRILNLPAELYNKHFLWKGAAKHEKKSSWRHHGGSDNTENLAKGSRFSKNKMEKKI